MDDTVWDHSTFSKNRDRQLAHDVIVGLLNETVETAHARGYLSGEYFSVDATLIQARASRTIVYADAGGLQPHAHANAHGESGIEAKVGEQKTSNRPEIRKSSIRYLILHNMYYRQNRVGLKFPLRPSALVDFRLHRDNLPLGGLPATTTTTAASAVRYRSRRAQSPISPTSAKLSSYLFRWILAQR